MKYQPERISEDKKKFKRKRRLETLGFILLYAAVLAGLDFWVIRTFRGRWVYLAPICMVIAIALAGIMLLCVFFFSNWKLKAFEEESNAIVKEYREGHNGKIFWRKLTSMQYEPQSFQQETMWYFNLAVALYAQKESEEALKLLETLQKSAEGEEKKLVDAYIQNIRDNMR